MPACVCMCICACVSINKYSRTHRTVCSIQKKCISLFHTHRNHSSSWWKLINLNSKIQLHYQKHCYLIHILSIRLGILSSVCTITWQILAWIAKAVWQPHAESKVSLMCFGMQVCNHTFTYAMTYICMSDHTLSWFIKTGHLPVLGGQSGKRGPEGGVFWQLRDELPPRIRLIWPEH